MKKICSMLLFICVLPLFCEDSDPFFFYGVGGDLPVWDTITEAVDYTSMADGLEIPMQHQMYIADELLKNKDQSRNVIIGHSQGGMRALAYAGYANENSDSSLSHIDGVITVGAPNNGLSFLAQGLEVTRNEVFKAAQTIANGLNAAKIILPDINTGINAIDSIFDDDLDAKTFVKELQLDEESLIGTFLDENLDPATTSLAGMMPNSDFIRENIMEDRMVFSGWRSIRIWTISIKIPIFKREPNYHLPAETKYGFVVGTDSDVLDLTAHMIAVDEIYNSAAEGFLGGIFDFCASLTGISAFSDSDAEVFKSSRDAIDSSIDAYCSLMDIAEPLWVIEEYKCNTAAALAWTFSWINSGPYHDAVRAGNRAKDRQRYCRNGKSWLKNYESNYSQLLGTQIYENDCLIPSKDQYVDVTEFGAEFVDDTMNGRFEGIGTRFNHIEEMNHEQIWGPEGGLSTSGGYVDGGVLKDWLDEIYQVEQQNYSGNVIK